jgi:glyoxylase-like metal-dependent hydrolase (beta-lactamase superfamily II)
MGEVQRWTVGDVRVTSVLEAQTDHIPPELFFPDATAAKVATHDWVVPDFADADGNIGMRIQALVIEVGSRRLLVDPCVGNGKTLVMPFWNDQSWPFMERFEAAGFDFGTIDTVVHTHLHADHVGWDTQPVNGAWVPTFTSARHLYTEAAMEALREPAGYDNENVLRDSVQPILDAGLADMVAEDADLGDGLRLAPTPGHTPGHVSIWIESQGAVGLITGDILHHPVQCAETEWAEIGDADADGARTTRRRMLHEAASTGALTIGTHFPTRPAGHVVSDGDAWRFVPV